MPDSSGIRNDQDPLEQRKDKDLAVNAIRSKLDNIYAGEPDAKTEISEARIIEPTSPHQKFMKDLVNSGKDIATIQTEWHKYYLSLDDDQKKQVWDEFYAQNKNATQETPSKQTQEATMVSIRNEMPSVSQYKKPEEHPKRHVPSRISAVHKKPLTEKPKRQKLTIKDHIKSMLFGLAVGFVVIFIFMFSFFNEAFIAPFIQPSRNITATPIIVGASGPTNTSKPHVIIPKINVEIPVNYSVKTTNENTIENMLQDGVVHYPTTVDPGQDGNAAFFGHSSNNIFNPGKYKFAFVLLHTLVNGDTFYLTYNHTVYVYKVIKHFIVSPYDVSVLGSVPGQTATATLITCDPPGTSINRLVVIGKQISPSVSTDTAPTITPTSGVTKALPGNGPTLWQRFIKSTTGKVVLIMVLIALATIGLRTLNKRLLKKYQN